MTDRNHILSMLVHAGAGLSAGESIQVDVVHNDGYVAYARWNNSHNSPFRCWVNTAERRAHWECGSGDDWSDCDEVSVEIDQRLRCAMHRAAAAGLVACGACSQRC